MDRVLNFAFTNRYEDLGEDFYRPCLPTPVKKPALIRFNHELAADLGVSTQALSDQTLADIFSGNFILEHSRPLAMAYAGHQFGHYSPLLGDGRAIYLGELAHVEGGSQDVQLKGSGPTPYSRNGDGRAALGPVLREYLISEAMHKLGVPTTRALAAVTTGEQVRRDTLLPGGIITRTASSFIRVGSFQYFLMNNDLQAVRQLADYVIERNYPEISATENPYFALFEAIALRQAKLIVQWMQLGFIHGVMNTDNMSVAGETIDYGPCAFMDYYQHDQVYSSIDRQGRYAYANQPNIAVWNLARLAESLLPLFHEDADSAVAMAHDVLEKYTQRYAAEWLNGFRAKCGLTAVAAVQDEDDKALLESLLNIMHESKADFTLVFYHLSRLEQQATGLDQELMALFKNTASINDWLGRWRERLQREQCSEAERQSSMQAINPIYIPRNHQLEKVIRAAEDHGDFTPFHALHEVLSQPYQHQQGKEAYMQPPSPDEIVQQTFCGT